jgi:hypothetical protein
VCIDTFQVVDSPFSRLTDLMTELVVEQVSASRPLNAESLLHRCPALGTCG